MDIKGNQERGLIIFVKNPELGKVKTRLAKSIGDEQALAVYHKLLAHTKSVAEATPASRQLFYDTAVVAEDEWSNDKFIKRVQADGDLGARMRAAFEHCLVDNEKVVIIGSDCPEISPEIIETAFRRLELADIVIGPALDGGYYLLGMKEQHPELFADMEWSTESVFEETLKRIQAKGLLYTQCPTLSDMDDIEDLNKFPEFKVGWLNRS